MKYKIQNEILVRKMTTIQRIVLAHPASQSLENGDLAIRYCIGFEISKLGFNRA